MTRQDRAVQSSALSRRSFVQGSMAASTSLLAASAVAQQAKPAPRKIKVGLVGGGGRGSWIAGLFRAHGGYEFVAVADYFQEVADAAGKALGVDKSRCFSGLSGYKRLIDSGIEAVILQTPPYFFPEHVRAAVTAGLHVYMAKPVAVDVPGCLTIEAMGRQALEKKRCFLVDYQMPTDPINIEVYNRIRAGGLGPLAFVNTYGHCGGFGDPPLTKTIESRLRGLVWVNDIALGCDYIGNFDIHAIDAAIWVIGKRPLAAAGSSRVCRPTPHGDGRDVAAVVYEFPDGLIMNHSGHGLANNSDSLLMCQFFGQTANAQINYWGKAFVRGGAKHYGGGKVEDLYQAGAQRNIAAFHQQVTSGKFDNATVGRAVDGALTAILGREAAARHGRMTMEELLKENKRLEVSLQGLKE